MITELAVRPAPFNNIAIYVEQGAVFGTEVLSQPLSTESLSICRAAGERHGYLLDFRLAYREGQNRQKG